MNSFLVVASLAAAPACAQFFEETDILYPPSASGTDWFGAVELQDDQALIGAFGDDTLGNNAGRVYAYDLDENGQWVPYTSFSAGETTADDMFGADIALDGDIAYVGAWYDDHGGKVNAGSVYVFQRSGNSWSQVDWITASDAGGWDKFGVSIALEGDRMLIGAVSDDDQVQDAGAVYVFDRVSGTTWSEQGKIYAPDAGEGDAFGADLGLDGDSLVVGAWLDDEGAMEDCGSAYLFELDGESWEFAHRFLADDSEAGDAFGEAAATQGGLVFIGAHWDDVGSEVDAGSVYVYAEDQYGGWNEVSRIFASDLEGGDRFGVRLAIEGADLMIGAMGVDNEAYTECGAAYLFSPEIFADGFESGDTSAWTQEGS